VTGRIVAIGSAGDPTFRRMVSAAVDSGLAVDLVDIAALCTSDARVERDAEGRFSIHAPGGARIDIDAGEPILARLVDIGSQAPTPELARRCRAIVFALNACLRCHPSPVAFRPAPDQSNFTKVFHMEEARRAGFHVPPTVVTTEGESAARIASDWGHPVICKGVSGFKTRASELRAEIWRHARFSPPALLQRRIEGFELRIHAFGEDLHAEGIASTEVDYRFAADKSNNLYFAVDLPEDLKAQVHAYQAESGLDCFGMDLRFDLREGRWYFLEANTLPAFHGYDARSRGALGRSLISYVTRNRQPETLS